MRGRVREGAPQDEGWRGFAVRDGNLVTGQQNFSPAETTAKLVEALGQ
jgi:putative intracellular protease/amidase